MALVEGLAELVGIGRANQFSSVTEEAEPSLAALDEREATDSALDMCEDNLPSLHPAYLFSHH
jgi:hypothetical protein